MAAHLSRQELIDEAIRVWKKYSCEYRVLLDNYYYLLGLKRALIETGQMKRVRLDTIKKSMLDEYPDIEFLSYMSESDALHHIKLLDNGEIYCIIREVNAFAESALTQTLRAKVYDYNHQIQTRDVRKSIYALDPSACKSKGKHSHRTQLSYTASLNINDK